METLTLPFNPDGWLEMYWSNRRWPPKIKPIPSSTIWMGCPGRRFCRQIIPPAIHSIHASNRPVVINPHA
ncbi:MAG: hypothetical protein K8S55_09405 [Phycisphaerae bacterium]|nr:hypothetical protein [Phycisphaerae bacterium]